MMAFNSRSLCNKTFGVTEFLKETSCNICFITEAWLKLKDTRTLSEIKDGGYKVKFQPRKGKRGGGVCVLYKDFIDLDKCKTNSYKSFEVMEVTIKGINELVRVSTIYRTGKMSTQGRTAFANELNEYLQSLTQKKGTKILVGDFNIHVEDENNLDRKELYDVTESYGFSQVVKEPTHKDGGTLDLVFAQNETKCLSLIQNSLYLYDLCYSVTSDHTFIEFSVPLTLEATHDKLLNFSYRDFKKVDPKAFSEDIEKLIRDKTSDFFSEDVNTATKYFHESLICAIDSHAPLINVSVKPKKTAFTNREIVLLKRRKRKAERAFRKYGNPADKEEYQSCVKDLQKLVKNTRNDYYNNKLLACKDDKKAKFKVFNKLLGNEYEQQLPSHANEVELCNEFLHFFSDKIKIIRNEIASDPKNLQSEYSGSLNIQSGAVPVFDTFTALTDDDVAEVFKSLPNKYCALDPVSAELYKQCLQHLCSYVKYIINSSLSQGIVPTSFKEALVKPKLKSHTLDKDMLKNFRPLSNLSFMSKSLERSAFKQLVGHLESNKLFSNFQSAYRKYHSCETAITKITNDILHSLDNKQCSFLLFLDLSSAFDTVDSTILLSILQAKFGIQGKVLQWLDSYLTNRTCKVNIGKSFSEVLCLLFGVPQGSILGPILFILYISDIEYIARCNGFKIHIYADDTQLYISFVKCDILSTISSIEQCLREIKCWMSHKFLKLNESKTEFLMISSKEDLYTIYADLCISFSGSIICPSLEAVNLGVTFDSTMSMQKYVNAIISKGYFHMSNFWKAASKLAQELKLQLVTSYVLPLIDYCNITLLAASKLYIDKLQKLLNNAVRFIFNLTGKKYRCSITPYLKQLHILPVLLRIKYKVALTVYKCFHDLAPSYLQDLIKPKFTFSHLRSSNDVYSLQSVVPKSKYGESTFEYAAPRVWNALPINVKHSPSLDCFKKRLKSHYFIEYFDV